jgi:methyl-accepting chemotaxis protein
MKKSEKALKKQAEASKETPSQLSADILKELRELKQAQLDGNRHLKTLKIFGWVFIALIAVALFFFIKFTFSLSAFMDELTAMFSSFIANLAAFNGFMENLSGTVTEVSDNLAAFNSFMENLTGILNDFAVNLAAFNEFINGLSGWF